MLISILTVTLNDLENLKRTYNSLLIQTNNDFEWIIKDGDSTDTTEMFYLSKIKNSGLNVKFIIKSDESLYDAMNQATKYASGEYFLFLNAGDCLASNETISLFSKEVMRLEKKFSFIYGDNIDITADGIQIYKKARELEYIQHSLPTSHQAIFYNSFFFKTFQYPLEYKIIADYAFTLLIFSSGYKDYLKLDFPICKFTLGGISQNNRKMLLKESFQIHRKLIGDDLFIASYKYIKSFIALMIIDKNPKLYRFLRRHFDKKSS